MKSSVSFIKVIILVTAAIVLLLLFHFLQGRSLSALVCEARLDLLAGASRLGGASLLLAKACWEVPKVTKLTFESHLIDVLVVLICDARAHTLLYDYSDLAWLVPIGEFFQLLVLFEFALKCGDQDQQMINFLSRRKQRSLTHDLIDSEDFKPLLDSSLGQLKIGDKCRGQAKLLLVLFPELLNELLTHVVASVDDAPILPDDIRALPLRIFEPYLLEIEMQAHELGQGLLPDESLRLEIHLSDGLGREAVTSLDVLPLTYTELHQRDLQDFNFLS